MESHGVARRSCYPAFTSTNRAMDAMDVDDVPPSSGMGSAGTSRVSTPLGAQAVASPGRRPASPSQPQQPPSRRSSLTSSVQGLSSGGGAAPQPAATGIPRTGIPAGGSSILAGINRSGGGSSPAPASAVSSDGGAGIPTRTSNENMAVPDNSGLARASTDGAGVPTTDQATLAYLRQSSAQPMQNPLGNMSSGGVSPMQVGTCPGCHTIEHVAKMLLLKTLLTMVTFSFLFFRDHVPS